MKFTKKEKRKLYKSNKGKYYVVINKKMSNLVETLKEKNKLKKKTEKVVSKKNKKLNK